MEVQAVWKKNYQVAVKARQFQVPIDEAPEFHGDDTGMMPTELFLCSLASCFCLALVYVARKKRIEIKDMRVNVRGEKDLKKFLFSRLVVEVDSSLPSETLEGIINLAKKYCFVSNTVSRSCPIEYVQKNSEWKILFNGYIVAKILEGDTKEVTIEFKIKKNYFQDTLRLMRISKSLREMEGVKNAVAAMATEKAKFALEDAGLMTPEMRDTGGSDLVMAVEAESEDLAKKALAKMEELISAGASQSGRESPDILHQEIRAINVGLESFKEALEAQGVKVVHVNWQVPANGDMKLINILKKMY